MIPDPSFVLASLESLKEHRTPRMQTASHLVFFGIGLVTSSVALTLAVLRKWKWQVQINDGETNLVDAEYRTCAGDVQA